MACKGQKAETMTKLKTLQIPETSLVTGNMALGCMRISSLNPDQLYELIRTALDLGMTFFDHADIYGGGDCEKLFGEVLEAHPELRREMIIQSKCDIVTGDHGGPRYDTGKDYILQQARQSVKRLNCGYLDILLLHRPDPLMDPAEVAEAFDILLQEGTVRHFGVSNFPASKIRMLQQRVSQPLIINQIQLSAVHAPAVDEDVFFNMMDDHAITRASHILDYAMENNILIQCWCPLQASWEDGTFLNNPKYEKLNQVLQSVADHYGVSKAAVSAAWLLRLPQKIQVICGTTSPEHLRDLAAGSEIELTRQEWYDIYTAQHYPLP